VHRLSPSKQTKQVYDVLIFLKAHKEASLLDVEKVEYYFGKHWGNKIFTSTNKWNSFAIGTSAFGTFLCTAHVHFTDGYVSKTWRYIDFEMGTLGDPRSDEAALTATAGTER
jgi:prokaryotic YEATS domain